MPISPETLAACCLLVAMIAPPCLGAALFCSALNPHPNNTSTIALRMGLAVILLALWLPTVAAMPTIAQTFILV